MPLNGATLLAGPSISITGGTVKTFTSNGLTVKNGIQIIDASVTDFRIRPVMTVKVTQPVLDKVTGKWLKGKKEISLTIPKLLADGSQEFPNITVILKDHPENSAAEIQALREFALQTLNDADFASFWAAGSVA